MSRHNLQGIVFDMDGVLYNADHPIAGAAETLAWVQRQRIPYRFVTNTSSRSRDALVQKLAAFGIAATAGQILTPAVTAAAWLRAQPPGEVALFVRPAACPDFNGLACVPDDAEAGARYVVIGDLGDAWDYRTLNRAFRLLQHNPESRLIALGMTRYWQTPEGLSLDVAPFVAALEHATGRKAVVLGKPAADFFHRAADQLALPPAAVMMIGDDIQADIEGAQAAGLVGVLVQTGKFRPADLNGAVKPDVVLPSIADLPSWWNG
ncbi:MAG TPA: TIGR01458 family HAD-type hydrolase [Bryobacteraceae bacterium]|jgi:HAD superfamily hydrolase (TIGR01458 family)